MYIPSNFLTTNKTEIVAFMKQYSFATLITAKNNLPVATHLPFAITEKNEKVILHSHFAKANPQWIELMNKPVLVIFSEPHAYISPRHYEKDLNVPTWDYISVHAYCEAKLITEESMAFEVLEQTINTYDPAYLKQWAGLPMDYKQKMVRGIVAVELTVTDLQASKKLSQNKTVAEQERIIEALSGSDQSGEKQIAAYMKDHLNVIKTNNSIE